jgi:hypothetical protein
MPKIHFIWWGPNRGDDCTETPNDFARSFLSHEIVYWCKAEHQKSFEQDLSRRIRTRACDSVRDILGEGPGEDPFLKDIDDILYGLVEAKAFSALKDILSLIILWKHGGYYFDTTTRVASSYVLHKYAHDAGVEAATLMNALKEPPSAVRLALLDDGDTFHLPFLQTGRAIESGGDPRPALDGSKVPLVDVWAMYAPAGDTTIRLALDSYISRCNRMGLNRGGHPSNFDQLDGTQTMQGPYRDDLIGNLIIRAIYDALLTLCDGDGDRIASYCWPAVSLSETDQSIENGASKIVPSLGIAKRYTNSWRRTLLQ